MPKLRRPRGPTQMVSARLPVDLFDKLEAEAVANDRSLVAEIIRRLRMSFEVNAPISLAEKRRIA